MDQHHFIEQLRMEHRHSDGSWVELAQQRSAHDAADVDLERAWATRMIFSCTACEETLTVVREAGGGTAAS